jgi:hypothetical protein
MSMPIVATIGVDLLDMAVLLRYPVQRPYAGSVGSTAGPFHYRSFGQELRQTRNHNFALTGQVSEASFDPRRGAPALAPHAGYVRGEDQSSSLARCSATLSMIGLTK